MIRRCCPSSATISCFVGLALCLVVLSSTSAGARDARPNILFIAVDDLRPSIGCYGDPRALTPNIDRLAARGMRFDRAYCQVAVCNPSRASLMTGLRPDELGVWTLPIHFRESKPDAVTLPQWLRRFGYLAVGHGKIYHNPTPDPQSWSEPIRPLRGVDQGYPDGWQDRVREVQRELPAKDWRKNNLRGPATASPEVEDERLVDGARTSMAIEDLRRLGRGEQPFFLAMGFIRPHLAWIAPRKYWDMHDPATLPVVTDGVVTPRTPPYALSTSYELTHYVDLADFPTPWDERRIAETEARHLMHAYYACVSYVDAQIGRLLDALEEEGLAENTIVVLWSDHGWKLGEFNAWGKMTNYEIDTRVPLIIAAPGTKSAGQSFDGPVELLDLFPTLCDLVGIDTPEFTQGTSLAPVLRDPESVTRRNAYSQYHRVHEGRQYMGYALRSPTHRFVEWRDFTTGEVTARELYDHRRDHVETANIVDDVPEEMVQALTAELLEKHPRRALSLVPAVHSDPSPGRLPSAITFVNRTDSDLLVYPITQKGARGRESVVPPGKTSRITARIGGVFVVESRDGKVHEIHSPSYPPSTIEVMIPSEK